MCCGMRGSWKRKRESQADQLDGGRGSAREPRSAISIHTSELGKEQGSDAIIEGRFFHVIDVGDGTFLRCREYLDRAQAVAAFESPE